MITESVILQMHDKKGFSKASRPLRRMCRTFQLITEQVRRYTKETNFWSSYDILLFSKKEASIFGKLLSYIH